MTAAAPAEQATRLLIDWSNGHREAAAGLMPLVYDELRGNAPTTRCWPPDWCTKKLTSGWWAKRRLLCSSC